MVAMRDMLANIQFREPQWEDNQDRDEEEWDWRINKGTIKKKKKKVTKVMFCLPYILKDPINSYYLTST